MRERNKLLKANLEEIATKHNIPLKDVLVVEESMWKFVRTTIQDTDTNDEELSKAIYLRYLGTIYIAPGRIKKIRENINKNKL